MNRDHLRWSTVLWAVEKPVLSKYSMTHLEIKGRSGTLLSNYSLCVCVCVCVCACIFKEERKRESKRERKRKQNVTSGTASTDYFVRSLQQFRKFEMISNQKV